MEPSRAHSRLAEDPRLSKIITLSPASNLEEFAKSYRETKGAKAGFDVVEYFASAAADCDLASADEHHHANTHDHAHLPEQALSAMGLFAGLCVHTVVDGIALGAVIVGSGQGASLAGVSVFLAILLHKPLDALSIETVMGARGWSSTSRWTAGTVFALLCPLTAAAFYIGASALVPYDGLLPASLAFAAGAFICIALGDLLPEVQFHSHDRL